jgi:hypothetical protein
MVIQVGVRAAKTVFAGALLEGLTQLLNSFVTCAHAFQGLQTWCCEGAALNGLGWATPEAGWGAAGCALFFDGHGDLGDGVGDHIKGIHMDEYDW